MNDIENESSHEPENPIVKGDWLALSNGKIIEEYGQAYHQDENGDWTAENGDLLTYFDNLKYQAFRCPEGDWHGVTDFLAGEIVIKSRPLIPMNLTECLAFCEKVGE